MDRIFCGAKDFPEKRIYKLGLLTIMRGTSSSAGACTCLTLGPLPALFNIVRRGRSDPGTQGPIRKAVGTLKPALNSGNFHPCKLAVSQVNAWRLVYMYFSI